MITNCFVSDGIYFYDSTNYICHKSPTEACENPELVDITNGNAILGRCGHFKVSNRMNLAPNEIGFVIENYEPKHESYFILFSIILVFLIALFLCLKQK